MNSIKIIKGHIIYTREKDYFELHADSYMVVENKKIVGIFKDLPDIYEDNDIIDYGNAIIIPSFIDLHIHAPQYIQMGIGLNLQLIDWLNEYTFKFEDRFKDVNYAKRVYFHFVNALYQNGSLRSCIFATIHNESTNVLVEELKRKKLCAYVGKVNMNQNAPKALTQTTECSIRETQNFIEEHENNDLVKPIITPRFAPTCTSDLLKGLGELSMRKQIPIQTHLAETKREIEWVKSLFPESHNYSSVYKSHKLYGSQKTIMAHAIYLDEEEIEMAKQDNIYLVHCPISNLNLASGIMPLTQLLDQGLKVGLGSDVGAGHEIAMQRTITSAIQCSKIRHVLNKEERILSEPEAFYLATKQNGSFFGKVGSFEEGYLFDALVIKDNHSQMNDLSPLEQLQKFLYCGGPESIIDRYLEGEQI